MSDIQSRLNDYWSQRASPYDTYQQRPERWEANRAAWSEIWSSALPTPPARALDLGTGTGYVAFLLAELGHQVTACDLAPGMLEIARARAEQVSARPDFKYADAVTPGFPDHSFDALTNRYLMWTLRQPDQALANWRRLLKPGGTLAIVDATWFPDGLQDAATDEFVQSYDTGAQAELPLALADTITEVRDRVAAAGFTEIEVTPLTSILELDKQYGVAPGHDLRLQHLVRARA